MSSRLPRRFFGSGGSGPERRMAIVSVLCVLSLAGVGARFWEIQIRRGEEYSRLAQGQYKDKIEILPDRGMILDRNGEILAKSLDCVSVVANPSQVKDARAVATQIAPILGEKPRALEPRLTTRKQFEWLCRKVNPEVGGRIEALAIPGVYTVADKERVHPAGSGLASVVGVTNTDGAGIEGIELFCDEVLTGEKGWRVLQRVPGNDPRPNMLWTTRSPESGESVLLTIDVEIQRIVEMELDRAVDRHAAKRGMAVVLDPTNGDIVAMAGVYGRAARAAGARPSMNMAVATQIEPGSTFKLVPFGAAIEHGLYRRTELLDAENGVAHFGSMILHDTEKRGLLTFDQAFEHSSNICTAKISLRVGAERFYRMARAFGFGTRTGVELPGEIPGLLRRPSDWSGRSLPTIAIGHEVTVTPLQLACAYAAIANGGVLYEPRLIQSILDRDGRVVRSNPIRPIRRVVSTETARILRELMQGVVVEGTAKGAYLERWAIAGKTGTADKVSEDWRGYDRTRKVASFAGFFPAWDPRLVAVVVIDEPSTGGYFGGAVAAPAFREMVEQIVNTSRAPMMARTERLVGPFPSRDSFATWDGFQSSAPPPEPDSAKAARGAGKAKGRGESAPATAEPSDADAAALAASGDSLPAGPAVPDLVGMTLRLASRTLRGRGFVPRVEGSGVVVAQSPPSGACAVEGSVVVLRGHAEEVYVAAAARRPGTGR